MGKIPDMMCMNMYIYPLDKLFTRSKKYASDNAQLMAKCNWEKNKDSTPTASMLGSDKKLGGDVAKVTSGNRNSTCEWNVK